MVRFYKEGYEQMVIIDDYLPVRADGAPSFVRGSREHKEMWPCILEKAYAKYYGNYSYIAAGKVQYALSDMTNGFPEDELLKKYQDNAESFYQKLKTLCDMNALMGAGTPENPRGDSAVSQDGIV